MENLNPKFALEELFRQINGKEKLRCKFCRRPPMAGLTTPAAISCGVGGASRADFAIAKSGLKLCVIIDRESLKNGSMENAARDALRGGADIIQYRDKTSCDKILIKEAKALRGVVKKYGKILIVNDRPDIAYAIGADGVHVGQSDMPVRYVRGIMGKKIIGASTGNAKEALRAEKDGADYLGIGPVFRSSSKPDKRPIGIKALGRIAGKARVPIFAIGGINIKNIAGIKKTGISGIAVISAATGGRDTYELVSALKHEMDI